MPYINKHDKKSMNLFRDIRSSREHNGKPHDPYAVVCPKCGEYVPKKKGFRLSALTCPKCGASLGKK